MEVNGYTYSSVVRVNWSDLPEEVRSWAQNDSGVARPEELIWGWIFTTKANEGLPSPIVARRRISEAKSPFGSLGEAPSIFPPPEQVPLAPIYNIAGSDLYYWWHGKADGIMIIASAKEIVSSFQP